MKRLLLFAALLVAIVGAIGSWQVVRFLNAPVQVPDDGLVFEIHPGSPLVSVSKELAGLGVIDHPTLFSWYARLRGEGSAVHAGEYRIEAGLTPPDLLQKFVAGTVRLHSLTIVEGWTFRELLARLANHEAVKQTFEYEAWPDLLAALGSGATRPEGLFLPETYRFPKDAKDTDILTQAYDLMQEALDAEWQGRADGLPLATKYEALILASIVEKETARADERSKIAGVFVRRLQKGMRLQTDPSVIYGIGPDFDGNLTRSDLEADTPYNTYTRRRLPPTPIAMPGRASIHAALHPAPGPELYFVATGRGDGSHKFSVTKAEHDTAVREYLARLREARSTESLQ
ncbi:MAG: endolytic transglycosylase MltG [Woeseiaceae bacterium]